MIPAVANTAFHLLTPGNSGTSAGAVAQAAAHPALAQVAALQFALPVLAMGLARFGDHRAAGRHGRRCPGRGVPSQSAELAA